MLLYVTVVIASDRSMISARSNIIGASLFVLLLSGFVHLVSGTAGTSEIGEQFKTVWAMREEITLASGGISGVIFGGLPKLLFGKAAAVIVVMVLMLVVFMIVTGTTLLGIYVFIKDSINKARDIKIKREPEEFPAESENRFQRKEKRFVPVDMGPEFTDNNEPMYIEELVGNASKRDLGPNKKDPKPFIDISTGEVIENKPAPIDEIIKKVNDKKVQKKNDEPKRENLKVKVVKEEKTADKQEEKDEITPVIKVYQKPGVDCLNYATNSSSGNYEDVIYDLPSKN